MSLPTDRPDGIPGSVLPGPWPVGHYAAALRERLRDFARVQVFGEVVGLKVGRARVWFELRDASGALPCSMWRRDWDALGVDAPGDGARVVAAGGTDLYLGSRTSSPAFTFAVSELRAAGEGDLLAQIERLRRALDAEGLLAPQKDLPRPTLPRTIGVVTGEGGKARDDVLAGLRRRGWAGRIVWAFAPVQDRHAAPAIARALTDLAACAAVDVVIVARGGGSLADLFAFCDEGLCRTVALLRVPVIASVGHHTDRTVIDDVAAVACSTPTHAAEAAVPVDCTAARLGLAQAVDRLDRQGRRAVLERARGLSRLSRAPAEHVARHRGRLRQQVRELRASARRAVAGQEEATDRRGAALVRHGRVAQASSARAISAAAAAEVALGRSAREVLERGARELERVSRALALHDPQRTLERGYALVEDGGGAPVTSARIAGGQPVLRVRLHDGALDVRPAATRAAARSRQAGPSELPRLFDA